MPGGDGGADRGGDASDVPLIGANEAITLMSQSLPFRNA